MARGSRADDIGPNDSGPTMSDLMDKVLALLEEAGCPSEINEQVTKLVEGWEATLVDPEPEYDDPDFFPW